MSSPNSFRTMLLIILAGFSFCLTSVLARTSAAASGPQADSPDNLKQESPSPPPDDRYKADILLVVAHPDDEIVVAGFLAKMAVDEHKRIAVLYGTRGNAGENQVGHEQAASLAAIREIEARRALAMLNISNVWFLNAPDTPALAVHNVLRSLETWNHGSTLAEVVRIIRLTRPAVVLTWLPEVVVGENHEDHQAASVITTEAFDAAGDPTQFAEQVAFPEDRRSYGVLMEGLRPWQPQKLYYFSDASHQEFLKGKGPEYSMKEVSPSRHLQYSHLAATMASIHQTQSDTGEVGQRALETGDFNYFEQPVLLVLGKSLVGGSTAGDILEGTVPEHIPYAPVRGYQPSSQTGISVELGGPWSFYQEFWQAHNLGHLKQLLPVPEIGVGGGGMLPVPLLLHNNTNENRVVTLRISLPPGWSERKGSARYPISGHDVYPVGAMLVAPSLKRAEWQEIRFNLEFEGEPISSVTLRVHVGGPSE